MFSLLPPKKIKKGSTFSSAHNKHLLNWQTSEEWNAESTIEPPSSFETWTPGLVIHCLNSRPLFHITSVIVTIPTIITKIILLIIVKTTKTTYFSEFRGGNRLCCLNISKNILYHIMNWMLKKIKTDKSDELKKHLNIYVNKLEKKCDNM